MSEAQVLHGWILCWVLTKINSICLPDLKLPCLWILFQDHKAEPKLTSLQL